MFLGGKECDRVVNRVDGDGDANQIVVVADDGATNYYANRYRS